MAKLSDRDIAPAELQAQIDAAVEQSTQLEYAIEATADIEDDGLYEAIQLELMAATQHLQHAARQLRERKVIDWRTMSDSSERRGLVNAHTMEDTDGRK